MPKVIKKRIGKKTENEGVINSFEKLKDDINQNRKNVIKVVIAVLAVVIIAAGVFGYRFYTSNKADVLNRQAYKLYNNLNQIDKNTKTLSKTDLTVILNKLKESYKLLKSPVTLLYIANCYYDLSDMKECEKTLIEVNNRFSGDKGIISLSYLKLYFLYREIKDDVKAEEIINTLYALDTPYYKDVCLFQMGMMLKAKGKSKEALTKFEEIVKRYAESPYNGQAIAEINALKPPVEKPAVEMPLIEKPADDKPADVKK